MVYMNFEIRESGLDGSVKVVVKLPQGLGWYGVENASESVASSAPSFAWYLKNHLGSTMLVYGTGSGSGSVKAAYDYRAFGEQVDLTLPADKVTENFTGKELDDETNLSNHGARMLDPMIGIWIAVDPKRFFPSPYLYMGNGYNPIKFADLNGMAPDDPFGSQVGAAQDFARTYNDDAIRNNVEYSAAIYSYRQNGKTLYSYNIPIKGSANRTPFDRTINIAKGQSFETTVHAHGSYDLTLGTANDLPSGADFQNNFLTPFPSKGSAFLSNPSGYLVEYGPN